MHEYIEREAAIKTVCNCSAHTCTIETCFRGCVAAQALSALPASDVVEVRHGRWERIFDKSAGGPRLRCSLCRSRSLYAFYYCPDCGARMDGGQDE